MKIAKDITNQIDIPKDNSVSGLEIEGKMFVLLEDYEKLQEEILELKDKIKIAINLIHYISRDNIFGELTKTFDTKDDIIEVGDLVCFDEDGFIKKSNNPLCFSRALERVEE